MAGWIENVQIHHPGGSGEDYWTTGLGAQLAGVYGELLGMRLIDVGYKKLARDDQPVQIGFEYAPDDPPPAWPDPERPAQGHLDIEVADLDEAEAIVLRWGGTRLHSGEGHRVCADAFGHPFCLSGGGSPGPGTGRIAGIVFDCFSPRALAPFYEELLGFRRRVLDTEQWVVIAADDPRQPMLGFQQAAFTAAQWPDPAFPAQFHLDLGFDDVDAARALAEGLGAIRLDRPSPRGGFTYADPAAHPFCGLGADG